MSTIEKALYYMKNNRRMLCYALLKRLGWLLSDKCYLQLLYRLHLGERLNLDTPTLFSEKIQWLKLHDRNPRYREMIDKYEAKKYVAQRIGKEYIIPTLGVWNSVDEIPFDKLPAQFVLKTTHGGGNEGVVICKDKSQLDIATCKARLRRAMKQNLYYHLREWGYKNLPHRIIAEQYMEDASHEELTDYKFYCFNGRAHYCQVIGSRNSSETIDFYDANWEHQSLRRIPSLIQPRGQQPIGQSATPIERPRNHALMVDLAEQLSAELPFVRVDLYEINGKVYFGELTLYPASGLGAFEPAEWNEKLGNMLQLPSLTQ